MNFTRLIQWGPCVPTQEEPDWNDIYAEVKRVASFANVTPDGLKNQMVVIPYAEHNEKSGAIRLYSLRVGDTWLVLIKWHFHGRYAEGKLVDIN